MGNEKPVANSFFIGVDIQALATFRGKILKKSIGMFWWFQKKAIPLHSQSGKQLTVDK